MKMWIVSLSVSAILSFVFLLWSPKVPANEMITYPLSTIYAMVIVGLPIFALAAPATMHLEDIGYL